MTQRIGFLPPVCLQHCNKYNRLDGECQPLFGVSFAARKVGNWRASRTNKQFETSRRRQLHNLRQPKALYLSLAIQVIKNTLPAYPRFGVQERSPIDLYTIVAGIHPQTAR